jgi:hypothetical protein
MLAAPFAKHYFNRNVVLRREFFNCMHCLLVLAGQKEVTIETVQTTGGGQVKIIHNEFSLIGHETML